RFGDEGVALLLELALQRQVVLDDAVVDDDDAAGAVAMRMRVLFGRPTVRRPSRVAEAVPAVDGIPGQDVLEPGEFPGAAPDVDLPVVDDRDARGVIAAILEPPKPFDDDGHRGPGSDVTDDSAHVESSCPCLVPGAWCLVRFVVPGCLVH